MELSQDAKRIFDWISENDPTIHNLIVAQSRIGVLSHNEQTKLIGLIKASGIWEEQDLSSPAVTGGPDRPCPICEGSGELYRDEFDGWTSRRKIISQRGGRSPQNAITKVCPDCNGIGRF